MTERNLERPANLMWFSLPVHAGTVSGEETRHFERLVDAIRYAMEELGPRERATVDHNGFCASLEIHGGLVPDDEQD